MGKKINFDEKSKFKRFLSGKGFYVALAVCLVAVCGVAVGTFINSLPQLSSDSSNPASVVSVTPTTKEKPVDKPVTNIPDDRTTTAQATTTGKTTAVNEMCIRDRPRALLPPWTGKISGGVETVQAFRRGSLHAGARFG